MVINHLLHPGMILQVTTHIPSYSSTHSTGWWGVQWREIHNSRNKMNFQQGCTRWFQPTHLKNMLKSNWESFPNFWDENKTYGWNHQWPFWDADPWPFKWFLVTSNDRESSWVTLNHLADIWNHQPGVLQGGPRADRYTWSYFTPVTNFLRAIYYGL